MKYRTVVLRANKSICIWNLKFNWKCSCCCCCWCMCLCVETNSLILLRITLGVVLNAQDLNFNSFCVQFEFSCRLFFFSTVFVFGLVVVRRYFFLLFRIEWKYMHWSIIRSAVFLHLLKRSACRFLLIAFIVRDS